MARCHAHCSNGLCGYAPREIPEAHSRELHRSLIQRAKEVDDEGDIDEALPARDVGEVVAPQCRGSSSQPATARFIATACASNKQKAFLHARIASGGARAHRRAGLRSARLHLSALLRAHCRVASASCEPLDPALKRKYSTCKLWIHSFKL